jgi:hypothetical protein
MALIATIGASDANSYVTQAEATAYFLNRIHSSAWEDFENKSQVLITSSQMLDWYVKWKGTKQTETQFMQWPRSSAIRGDGTEIDEDTIPPEVKVAVYELALSSLAADRTEDDPLAGIGQLQAGSLMIKAGAEKPNQTNKKALPEKVYKILKDVYIQGSFSVVRLMRA